MMRGTADSQLREVREQLNLQAEAILHLVELVSGLRVSMPARWVPMRCVCKGSERTPSFLALEMRELSRRLP